MRGGGRSLSRIKGTAPSSALSCNEPKSLRDKSVPSLDRGVRRALSGLTICLGRIRLGKEMGFHAQELQIIELFVIFSNSSK